MLQLFQIFTSIFPEGAFQPRVIASNALGNVTGTLSSLFWIQITPGDISISRKCANCPISAMVFVNRTFSLITNGGTNVSYDWNLGDGTTQKNHGEFIYM
jgi:hypothetical protein